MPIQDAIADANTLRVYVAEHVGSGSVKLTHYQHVRPSARLSVLLAAAGRYGSDAIVEALSASDEWAPHRAAFAAASAAQEAFRAVPGLRD